MKKIESISIWIENHSTEIIENINQESIDVYNFLKREFKTSNVNENYLFQFVFRSFYRLDNAGLTTEFKKEYFRILEECRNETSFDFKNVLNLLWKFPNLKKDKHTFQFSFVTKMSNTINVSMPIYDSKVAKMFSFSPAYQKDFENKFRKYWKQFHEIKNSYELILKENLLPKMTQLFDQTFINNDLSEMKKLDFIFWSAGKLKSKSKNNDL